MLTEIGALGHAVAEGTARQPVAFAASMGEGRTVLETGAGQPRRRGGEALAKEVLKHAGK